MPAVREPDGTPVTGATSVVAGTALRSRSSGVDRRGRQWMMDNNRSPVRRPGFKSLLIPGRSAGHQEAPKTREMAGVSSTTAATANPGKLGRPHARSLATAAEPHLDWVASRRTSSNQHAHWAARWWFGQASPFNGQTIPRLRLG